MLAVLQAHDRSFDPVCSCLRPLRHGQPGEDRLTTSLGEAVECLSGTGRIQSGCQVVWDHACFRTVEQDPRPVLFGTVNGGKPCRGHQVCCRKRLDLALVDPRPPTSRLSRREVLPVPPVIQRLDLGINPTKAESNIHGFAPLDGRVATDLLPEDEPHRGLDRVVLL